MARPSASSRSERDGPSDAGFLDAVLEIVRAIPPGRVMTYGDVAAVLGSRGARLVGQIMARHGEHVPWWRVVRSGGLPPAEHERAALERYRLESTPLSWPVSAAVGDSFDHYRIRMDEARWWPGESI